MVVKKIHLFIFLNILSFGLFAQPSLVWQTSLGGSNEDAASYIIQTNDGGYIVVGHSMSSDGDVSLHHGLPWIPDYWITKLSSTGTLQWQKIIGGTNWDQAFSIKELLDGYIIVGQSNSNDMDVSVNKGAHDFWIVKLDGLGGIVWEKSYGGNSLDVAYDIAIATDGGYLVVGTSQSTLGDVTGNHGSWDLWVIKMDNIGNLIWQKSYGGSGNDYGHSVKTTNDGGYVIAGNSTSNDGDLTINKGLDDYWIVKIDSIGNIEWQKSYGGTGNDEASSIDQTSDGGYIVAGYSNSQNGDVSGNQISEDYWVVKLDSLGGLEWEKCFGGSSDDRGRSIQESPNNGYIVAGEIWSSDGDVGQNEGKWDYWIAYISDTGTVIWENSFGGPGNDYAKSFDITNDGGFVLAGGSDDNGGDVSGNNGVSDFWIIKLSKPLNLLEYDTEVHMKLYPNPISNLINIESEVKINKIEIFNLYGRKIKSINFEANSIDISELSNGVYFIRLMTKEGIVSQKFIKQ